MLQLSVYSDYKLQYSAPNKQIEKSFKIILRINNK